ncbi:MAG: glycosyltransferase family 9 protein [Thermoanaerobaculia bacterium]
MTDPAPRSPVVVHHGALGDTIQLTAMLQALAARWGAPCDLLAGPAAAPKLLAGLDFVREVRFLGTRKRPYWTSPRQWRLVRWLREREGSPSYVVERWRHPVAPWSSLTRMEWLLRRAGVPASATVTTAATSREPLEHAVDYQLRLARLDPPAFDGGAPYPAPEPSPRPLLRTTPDEVEECRRWLGGRGLRGEPLVLFQSEARRSKKRGRWPAERWVELARSVLEELPEARVLLMGAPSERESTRALARATGDPRVQDVAGDLPLRRLFALLTLGHSCISVDTGPAQAAGALGCPVAVLAGTADPRRNRPLGPPERVQVVTGYGDGPWPESGATWFREHDIRTIPVDAVLAAWRRLAPGE